MNYTISNINLNGKISISYFPVYSLSLIGLPLCEANLDSQCSQDSPRTGIDQTLADRAGARENWTQFQGERVSEKFLLW